MRTYSLPSSPTNEKRRATDSRLFHQIGITDIDQWFCDYTACDQAYLLHFYRTGEKRDFRAFWRTQCAC